MKICLITGDGGIEEEEASASALLQNWEEDQNIDFGGPEEQMMICNYPTCFPG